VVLVVVGEQHRAEAAALVELLADRVEVLAQGRARVDQPCGLAPIDPCVGPDSVNGPGLSAQMPTASCPGSSSRVMRAG